nr:MAG TPA: hypothetical protein [Caudoviricetes sp.]
MRLIAVRCFFVLQSPKFEISLFYLLREVGLIVS